MSTIAVNAITDASGGATTTINSVTPNANNVIGKNLVINGAMQIAQRGTSTTGVTSAGYHAVDRFLENFLNLGTWTVSQDTDAPDGFSNSLKIACTTADASPAASDRANIQYRIEGQTLQQLAKGTASAKSVTLSFWVKSNKTGNMQVNFVDNDNARTIGNTVTINSASTWEKKSITFAGDTSGAFVNDNNLSAIFQWWLDSGSDFSSGSVPTSWQATNNIDNNAGGTLALADSTSNYINITGVQLEVGSSATEFEHRPYGIELQLCQRYYFEERKPTYGTFSVGRVFNNKTPQFGYKFPTPMRTLPSVSNAGSGCAAWYGSTSFTRLLSPAYYQEDSSKQNVSTVSLTFAANASLTDNNTITLSSYSTDSGLSFSAEL
jgi:hypothetical protein